MILHGNQRGAAKDLARHLLKDENEHVEIHELRGFASDDLTQALNETYAISRGTRCKQFLFSLSLSPPPREHVATEDFEAAIGQVEDKLGLTGQPRAIVFHEKEGRRHAHAVWSRIDAEEMKAVQLSHSKLKLRDVSRSLFMEHGWIMPRGLLNSQARDPRNFTLEEWQQAKRAGKDARNIKTVFQDCWAVSDSQGAFTQALKERGFVLARGDRRGFVALDHHGEVYGVAKWTGIRTKEVRARLKDAKSLLSVDEATIGIATDMAARLRQLEQKRVADLEARKAAFLQQRRNMASQHEQRRKALAQGHEERWQNETKLRQDRYNKGLRGLFDRITGERHRTRARNEREAFEARRRDRTEKDALIFRQLDERRHLQSRLQAQTKQRREQVRDLQTDIAKYDKMRAATRDSFKTKRQKEPRRARNRPRDDALER